MDFRSSVEGYVQREDGGVILTHGQMRAINTLRKLHDRFPSHGNFASVYLGASTAATLRKLSEGGLVAVTRGGRGSRQFFAITDAGRSAVKEAA